MGLSILVESTLSDDPMLDEENMLANSIMYVLPKQLSTIHTSSYRSAQVQAEESRQEDCMFDVKVHDSSFLGIGYGSNETELYESDIVEKSKKMGRL